LAAPKGHKKWGGRKAGTPNKVTGEIRDLVLRALDEAKDGGALEYLKWAALRQPVAFLGLLGKTIPREAKVELEGGVTLTITRSFVRGRVAEDASAPKAKGEKGEA